MSSAEAHSSSEKLPDNKFSSRHQVLIANEKESKMAKVKKQFPPKSQLKVKITTNGPYLVTGRVPLSEQIMRVDADGQCHGGKRVKIPDTGILCALPLRPF